MKSSQRALTVWGLVVVVICSTLATGCTPLNWFGNNLDVNVVIPLGLGGSPGIFNPFGIVQALVNSALGQGGSNNATAYENPAGAPSSPTPIDPAQGIFIE